MLVVARGQRLPIEQSARGGLVEHQGIFQVADHAAPAMDDAYDHNQTLVPEPEVPVPSEAE